MVTLEGYTFTKPELRKWLREHPWRPGSDLGYGKGIVTPTGTVYTWQAKVGGQYIHHADIMQVMGITDLDRWGNNSGAFAIYEDRPTDIDMFHVPAHLEPKVREHVAKIMEDCKVTV